MKTNKQSIFPARISFCLLFIMGGLLTPTANQLFSQIVSIPDTAFLAALIEQGVDTNNDSLISYEEAEELTELDVSVFWGERGPITDMTGIEAFVNLETLICARHQITSLDVSKNTALTSLDCSYNQLTHLDVSNNIHLSIRREIFSRGPGLNCSMNRLTSLDVSNNTALLVLQCNDNQLTSLNVSNNTRLRVLNCSNNQLSSLDVSKNIYLQRINTDKYYGRAYGLNCSNNQLTSLDISNNLLLSGIFCSGNQITELDLSNHPDLDIIQCDDNQLTQLDISRNRSLISLSCNNNQLTNLDVSNNRELILLSCGYNNLTSLELSNNTALRGLSCNNNQLTSLDLTNNFHLDGPNFSSYYAGLDCSHNQLTSLDISNNQMLTSMDCGGNQIKELDVSNNSRLININCDGNQLTSLDVSGNTALTHLNCSENQLSSLNLSNNSAIKALEIRNMPTLNEVCVWVMPFSQNDVFVTIDGSSNVNFIDCSAPDLVIIHPSYQPVTVRATSTEDGMIFLVPQGTENEIAAIRGASLDSVLAVANVNSEIALSGLDNGLYWLYAIDGSGNISEKEVLNIIGVGIDNSLADQFNIYPNPTIDQLNIEAEQPDNYSIHLYSRNGQLIYSTSMEGSSHKIDLSTFSRGIYFLTVRSKEAVITEKVVRL